MNIQTINPKRPKDPAEVWSVTFNFSKITSTIDSATWSIECVSGTDPDVATMLLGVPQISGGKTIQLIRNGVHGNVYLVRVDAIKGVEKFTLVAYLKVKRAGSL